MDTSFNEGIGEDRRLIPYTVIERLQDHLAVLHWDAVLRGDYISATEEPREYLENQARYNRGIEICEQYFDNDIDIDDFCIEI